MTTLKTAEYKVLKFCRDYIALYRFSPSIRDIMTEVGMNSTSHVRYLMNCLEEKGMISRVRNQARSISITEEGKNV